MEDSNKSGFNELSKPLTTCTEEEIYTESLDDVVNKVQKKKTKRGIIYLSTIPPYMNVTKVREIFGEFGKVGRVFLQPATTAADEESGKQVKKRKSHAKHFTEGWVEFESKRKARSVAKNLNSNRIGSRKKSKFYDYIWNIKYLPRFKWIHLSERLAYERAAHNQRLRAEISQARKEASHFQQNLDRSDMQKKKLKIHRKKPLSDE